MDKSASRLSWFWIFQIIVGCICLILSIVVLFYGTKSAIGAYTWLFLAGIGLIILGVERVISGLQAKDTKTSSRLINIGVGTGLIIYIVSGFFFPAFATKWLIVFLGFGLLANGITRIVKGITKKKEDGEGKESHDLSSLAMGIMITSLSILVLSYPKLGLALLLVMTAIALAVSGIQVILAGIRTWRHQGLISTSKLESFSTLQRKPSETMDQESSAKDSKTIWKSGSWFRDEYARYILFRGVNFASRSKLPPYLPISPLKIKDLSELDLNSEIQLVKSELDLLKKTGFNIVRLLISWKALEPRPNPNLNDLLPEGIEYLSYMKQIIDELYLRNFGFPSRYSK
jgi:uncharacterized membrane protein HdeD (DUF308 family)